MCSDARAARRGRLTSRINPQIRHNSSSCQDDLDAWQQYKSHLTPTVCYVRNGSCGRSRNHIGNVCMGSKYKILVHITLYSSYCVTCVVYLSECSINHIEYLQMQITDINLMWILSSSVCRAQSHIT